MPPYADLTREIDAGESGPETAALFDLDRTLIAGFSAVDFVRDGIRSGRLGPPTWGDLAMATASYQLGTIGFSSFIAASARAFAGLPEADMLQLGEDLFQNSLAPRIHPEARALVDAHRRKRHTLAVVSSATPYQVVPVARELGIENVLCSRLEVQDGVFTGDVVRPSCAGEGKLIHAQQLAERIGVDLTRSYFYTDSEEDLALLEAVGNPRPTNPSQALAAIAARWRWPSLRFTHRGLPSLGEMLGTGLAIASLVPSVLLGLPAAYFGDDWQRAINIATSTWGELATALARIEIRVTGEEHLWSHRPAVFIFNHQSGLDALVLCKLLRRDFVGIGKAELKRNPIFGPAMELVGTVFIDRHDHARALEALEPAVEALRRGISLAIAPEGTRSITPHPGRFKKGAFVMAMRAGVPIVPIVLRNTLDALPKHSLIVRPTTVEVVVLPPVPTTGWTNDELDQHIAEIHRRYEQAIEGVLPSADEASDDHDLHQESESPGSAPTSPSDAASIHRDAGRAARKARRS